MRIIDSSGEGRYLRRLAAHKPGSYLCFTSTTSSYAIHLKVH